MKINFYRISRKFAVDNLPSGIISHMQYLIDWKFQSMKMVEIFPKFDTIFENRKNSSTTTRGLIKNINASKASHKLKNDASEQMFNPFLPTVAFNICCPRDCVSRHNGGISGAPLKPLRDDSALRALSSLRGLSGL